MTKGKVKWYNEEKGFGFIETESGHDIFVHRSGIENKYGALMPEEKVIFEVSQGDRGPIAVKVKSEN